MSSKIGAWCAGLGLMAAMSVLGLWLFGTAPELRRQLVLVSLGCVLVCVVVVALNQRSSGGRRPFREVAAAACTEAADEEKGPATESVSVPRTIPSRRGQQLRAFAWVIGNATVLVGVFALAVGAPQRPERVERIHSAGAEFGFARAEKVSDVRRKSSRGKDPYTATVVVQLPAKSGGEPVSATVKATTKQPLRPGDPVEVLYAPAQPQLGAVAGDERSLGWELRGETMPAYMRWFFFAAWLLSCFAAVSHVSTRHGFRSYSRLGKRDKAMRGHYTRVGGPGAGAEQGSSGKDIYLEIGTDAGWVHFRTNVGKRGLPEAMEGQQLWLCWDAHRGARGSRISPNRTPAVLVFDTGLVVHGMVSVDEARSLNDSGVSVEKLRPALLEDRPLRLFDFRSQWPLFVEPLALQTCVVVVACAALLTFDVGTGWRWAAGIVGFLGAFAASGAYLSEDPPAKRAAP
ncbi:hypothetical protein [Streptomyces acidicola]|uniref:hypothetical protein n=1 Tax=Streptomyces acidicola TaxID=2596892 RepID=UPI00128D7F9C|nr:hypothetical protein [Streptomyces acidicola]